MTDAQYALLISPLVTALVLFFGTWAKAEWLNLKKKNKNNGK